MPGRTSFLPGRLPRPARQSHQHPARLGAQPSRRRPDLHLRVRQSRQRQELYLPARRSRRHREQHLPPRRSLRRPALRPLVLRRPFRRPAPIRAPLRRPRLLLPQVRAERLLPRRPHAPRIDRVADEHDHCGDSSPAPVRARHFNQKSSRRGTPVDAEGGPGDGGGERNGRTLGRRVTGRGPSATAQAGQPSCGAAGPGR